jgi:glutaminyl-peptide cyclotransferase
MPPEDKNDRVVSFLLISLALLAGLVLVLIYIFTPGNPAILPSPTPTLLQPSPTPMPTPLVFSGEEAYHHLLAQLSFGPRPTGSPAGRKTGDYILQQMKNADWEAEEQSFIFKGVEGRNIIAKAGQGPVVIVGAHYDTRPAADMEQNAARRSQPIPGANDGASGTAVLLELARVLDKQKLNRQVWLTFFDAEDRGRLDGWPFSVGANQLAQSLKAKPSAVVVLDMIGDADLNIYYERNSNKPLREEIWGVAAGLGYGKVFIPTEKHTITDDHIPFAQSGIPAVDIIDFDYPYWHTLEDTGEKVSPQSLEEVGRTMQAWLEKP